MSSGNSTSSNSIKTSSSSKHLSDDNDAASIAHTKNIVHTNDITILNNNNNDEDMADTKKKSGASAAENAISGFKLVLLILMVLQNSSTVLVGRYTRVAVDKKDLYVVNHLIMVTELGKIFLSCILEYFGTNGRLLHSFQEHVLNDPWDALKISVPALLYLVQNSLLYIALSNLTAPIFQVTYQGKLVTTAIVSVIMLQRAYNTKQWICLFALSFGVAVVVLGEDSKKSSTPEDASKPAQSLAVGLVAVSIACLSSALAGVYFEKVVKTAQKSGSDEAPKPPVSLWMRNIQLAFFSIVVAMGQNMYDEHQQSLKRAAQQDASSTENAKLPYLHGFTMWVWILIALQAGGGLLVAAVIKYADNVLKGLATGVSVVLATVCSMLLFGTPLTGQFTVGATLILVSVYFFSNDLPSFFMGKNGNGNNNNNRNTEMKPILPK